jgi:hypothetical protein
MRPVNRNGHPISWFGQPPKTNCIQVIALTPRHSHANGGQMEVGLPQQLELEISTVLSRPHLLPGTVWCSAAFLTSLTNFLAKLVGSTFVNCSSFVLVTAQIKR